MALTSWNEKASDKLKKLKQVKNPSAQQVAKIKELQTLKANKGMTTPPTPQPGPGDAGFTGQYTEDPNMTANQNAIQYSVEQGDIGLLGAANEYLPEIQGMGNYDYQGPGPATANAEERRRIEQQLFEDFERRDAPARQQENEDLARWSQATGNSVDSPAYAARAKQLADAQNARKLDAQTRATELGGQEYQRSFDMGNQAFDINRAQYENVRNDPLRQFSGIRGAVAGNAPAQDFSYQTRLQQQQGDINRRNTLATINAQRTGGARPSGGGRPSGGLTSAPQNYQVIPGIQNRGPGQQQPSFWSGVASSLGPTIGKGIGEQVGKWAGSLFS